jgi:uncharacterized membrane protein YoaK (UPF0700 family)
MGTITMKPKAEAPRQQGPLPALLIGLTIVTGLVDAFSYLELGRVFVANMTGNVVFLGFALADVGEISVAATLLAVAAHAAGAALSGRLAARWAARRAPHRGHLLAAATTAQAGLVLIAASLAATLGVHDTPARLILIALLAAAMGIQNAIVRRLAVPDLTTTVLTMTVTGLAADTTSATVRRRRLGSLAAMLVGALTGGALLHWTTASAPLWTASAALSACAVGAYLAARRPSADTWR